LVFSIAPMVIMVHADTSVTTSCSQQVTLAARAHQTTFDQQAAAATVTSDSQFAQYQQYNPVFSSVYDNWTFDANCNVTLVSVTFVYQLSNSSLLQVHENAQANEVTSMSIQPNLGAATFNHNDGNKLWSGYETTYNSGATTAEYQADATWSVPAVSDPYSGGCENTPDCELAVWVGLINSPLASASSVAQAGSLSQLSCGVGTACTQGYGAAWNYSLWYEFYPQMSTIYQCDPSGAGDSITTYVTNEASYLGSGYIDYWALSVTDSTNNKACTVNGYYDSGIGVPYYTDFILERPEYGIPYGYTLPKFGSVTMTAGMWAGSPYNSQTNGYYNLYVMENGASCPPTCIINIGSSAISSSNAFTSTWKSSSGT